MEIAIIETGGKQYTVQKGDIIRIEKLAASKGKKESKADSKAEGKTAAKPKEHQEGDTVVFDKVLFVDNGTDTTIGTPYIDKATVTGTISKIGRGQKVTVIHYKQKSRYFKKAGHRQPYFAVKIDGVK
jgi:large subunit ribosomal protein L21